MSYSKIRQVTENATDLQLTDKERWIRNVNNINGDYFRGKLDFKNMRAGVTLTEVSQIKSNSKS